MTLTARIPKTLDQALDAYCTEHGVTKTHVVQEAIAEYLVRVDRTGRKAREGAVSENYAALKRMGLIGCVSGMGGRSATKEVVRQRVLETLTRKR